MLDMLEKKDATLSEVASACYLIRQHQAAGFSRCSIPDTSTRCLACHRS